MRLNNKFLNESLAGSEALKLEDCGAFNSSLAWALRESGLQKGSRVSFAVLALAYVARVVSFPFAPCHH